jgi:hypothetical protein
MRDERIDVLVDIGVLLVGGDRSLACPESVSIGLSSGDRIGNQSKRIFKWRANSRVDDRKRLHHSRRLFIFHCSAHLL